MTVERKLLLVSAEMAEMHKEMLLACMAPWSEGVVLKLGSVIAGMERTQNRLAVGILNQKGFLTNSELREKIESQKDRIDSLERGLTEAINRFKFYAEQHRAKGTEEGDSKATANEVLAEGLSKLLGSSGG